MDDGGVAGEVPRGNQVIWLDSEVALGDQGHAGRQLLLLLLGYAQEVLMQYYQISEQGYTGVRMLSG
jgi:hypothetical protein